ncbi:MAG TPA: nucleotidyltransferase family protein, partial [Pyrinomonadaceae bacterium]|nr:nucleotidyltransferase family protein [Pyrinomonadaceae bacterium]
MNTLYQKTRASLIAIMLGGAWRNPLPALKISTEELAEISPLLLGSGAGALGWWRICESDLKESATALELLQAYRFHTIHATLHHHRIKQAFSLFRAAGIEPILIKGWANARLYPETGLRP